MNEKSLIDLVVNKIEKGDLDSLKNIASSISENRISEIFSRHNENYITPLYASIIKKNVAIVKFLLKDCHVDPIGYEYHYPITTAAAYGQLEIVKILFEFGAKLNATKNNYIQSPLFIACKYKYWNIARYLISKGEDLNTSKCLIGALNYITHNSEMNEFVKYLLECGVDVNTKDNNGETPLHECCRNDNLDIFKILIEKGATICKNNEGINQLQLAVLTNCENIFAFYTEDNFYPREEILICVELKGVQSAFDLDFTSSVENWSKVIEERIQFKESSFQRHLEHIHNYNSLIVDREYASIHSLIILERIFSIQNEGDNIIDNHFYSFIERISILNTEFWNALLNFDAERFDRVIFRFCNNIFAKKFRTYVQSLNFKDINSLVSKIAIRFINVTSEYEFSKPTKEDIIPNALIFFNDVYIYFDLACMLLILCLDSIKENIVDFDNKWFHTTIKDFINSRSCSFRICFHMLMIHNWELPATKVLNMFEIFCKLGDYAVNSVGDTFNTPLHTALKMISTDNFINILLNYGALINTRNEKGESIRELATKCGRHDICTGSSLLQVLIISKLKQSRDENQEHLPIIIKYFNKFH